MSQDAPQKDDSEKRSANRRAGLRRLLSLVAPYRLRFLLACLFLMLASAVGLSYPQFVRIAINRGLGAETSGEDGQTAPEVASWLPDFELRDIALILLGLFAMQAVFTWIRHYLMSWLGARAVADVRRSVIDRLVRLPPEWIEQRHTGELVGRIAGDVSTLEGAVGSELSMAVRNVVQLVGGLTLLFTVNVELTLFMLLVVPPMTISIMIFARRIRSRSRRVQDELGKTNARVQEILSGLSAVQIFQQEERESALYAAGVEETFSVALNLAKWRASFFAISSFSGFASIAMVIGYGARMNMPAGDLTAFLLYTSIVAVALASLTSLWAAIERASGATERLFEIIDTTPELRSPDSPVSMPPGPLQLTLEDVHFRYAARPDAKVLKGVSLTMNAGDTFALVGPSGSGKSSLASLIPRLYDIEGGNIALNGASLRELSLEDLRKEIAVVPQEPTLFSGTIAENIAYGDPSASRDRIVAAAKAACAHEFILSFPDGYETLCGERGVQLSGGQRQRLAIARALLVPARILVLDEATSHLDTESEATIHHNLQEAARERLVILIAHRLSTVRDCDQILVLVDGEVRERGRHDELMAKQGVYAGLVRQQSA